MGAQRVVESRAENKRQWLYPKHINGKLSKQRDLVGGFFLLFLFLAPFIRLNGEQLVLLDVLNRKFVFFGLIFSPQDFYLFVLAMLIGVIFIAAFTVVYGRVWCGWACPQTIFMELIFRRVERWIEGDASQRRKLDAAPLSFRKIGKKGLKHGVFVLISFFISNIFLAYIIGSEPLMAIVREPISENLTGFLAIWAFTAVFYFVFARLRELVCTVICPYGRMQGVLMDKRSMVVAYNYERGEPRGKKKRGITSADQQLGDCVDCDLCVQVCPTGIDIRKGTQMECINCTLCIDACDMVMQKINRPTRLIGFMSEEQIAKGTPFKPGKRLYLYGGVFIAVIALFGTLLYVKPTVSCNVLRARGTLYQLMDNGTVSNLYNAELVNKTNKRSTVQLVCPDNTYKIKYIVNDSLLLPSESAKLTFFVLRDQKGIKTYKSDIEIDVLVDGKVVNKVNTTFIAPVE